MEKMGGRDDDGGLAAGKTRAGGAAPAKNR
jgi:hypothetical protein